MQRGGGVVFRIIALMKKRDVLLHARAGELLQRRAVGAFGQGFVVAATEVVIVAVALFKPVPQMPRWPKVRQNMVHLAPLGQVLGQADRFNPHPLPVVASGGFEKMLDLDHLASSTSR